MMRHLLFFILTLLSATSFAQTTYDFVERDGKMLKMDLYRPTGAAKNICVVYVFGGGFVTGSRIENDNMAFFNDLSARGYTVVAIDYRLALQGVRNVGALNPKPVFMAVRLATEDLISATSYLIENHKQMGIDTSRMVLVGSSAGAITVLQTDYEMSRRRGITKQLPVDFRYAGVVSLAGALFSTEGRPKYGAKPAPTAFFHGTNDNVVVYKKIQILSIGMFGSDALVKIFDRNGYPYVAVRYEGARHEVAEFPRFYAQDQICSLIDQMADKRLDNQIDILVRDRTVSQKYKSNLKRKDLYNGN